jgi:hypothetical protein
MTPVCLHSLKKMLNVDYVVLLLRKPKLNSNLYQEQGTCGTFFYASVGCVHPFNDLSNGVLCPSEWKGKLFSQYVPSQSLSSSWCPEADFVTFLCHSLSAGLHCLLLLVLSICDLEMHN